MKKKSIVVLLVLIIAAFISFPVCDPFNTTLTGNYSDTPITFFSLWYSTKNFPVNIIDTPSQNEYLPLAPYDPTLNSFLDKINMLLSGYFFHLNETLAWNLMVWFIIFLSGFSIFYFCKIITKNETVSLFSAVMLMTFGYFLVESRLGHNNTIPIFAILFPLIAIEKLSSKKSRRNFVILTMSTLLIFSLDLLLALNFIVISTAYTLIFNRRVFNSCISALLIGFIMSLPFLTPVLSNYFNGGFERSQDNLIFLNPKNLMPGQSMSLQIWAQLPIFMLYIFKIRPSKRFIFFSVISLIYLLISTQGVIYSSLLMLLPFADAFRAVYRLVIIAELSISILVALALSGLIERYKPAKNLKAIVFFLFFALLLLEKTQAIQNITVVSYEKPDIFKSIANKGYTTVFYPLATEVVDWNFPNLYYEPLYYYFITLHHNKAVFKYVGYYELPSRDMDMLEDFSAKPSLDSLQGICSLGINSLFCSGCNRTFLEFMETEANAVFADQDIKILAIIQQGQERSVYLNDSYFYELNCTKSS